MNLGELAYQVGRERLNAMAVQGRLLPQWNELPPIYQQRFQEEVIRVSSISLQLLLPKEFWLTCCDQDLLS